MKKIFKLPIAAILVLVLVLPAVLAIPANSIGSPHLYDPFIDGIVSSYYHIDREKGFITGVTPGTTAEQLLNVLLPSEATVSHETLVTGSTVTVTATEPALPETRIYTMTVVVTGDLDGDGLVTIADVLKIKYSLLGEELSEIATLAADIDYDGVVTTADYMCAKDYLSGNSGISPGWPTGTTPEDPLLLMTPSTSDSWTVDNAISYCSDNEAIATIDNAGIITSMAVEGSTFVYALDVAGNIIDRILVTVLNENLTISLGESSRSLIMGQALTLSASFNHFIAAPIFWTSSDPAVVSVNQNGELTTNSLGTAVITATLRNGAKAECTIHVIPPLTGLVFTRPLYKLKPGHSRTLNTILTPADTGEKLLWSSSDPSIATVNSDGIVTGVSYGTVTITAKGKYSGLTASCSVKICDVKQVAITFDDGPSTFTAELLNYLRDAHIPATFFMVGNRLQSYPNTLIQMVADGHEIGYHSYSHTMQRYLSLEQIKSDYKAASDILRELTGAEFTVWRAPGGDINERILGCIPLPHINWSVDTYDWKTQDSNSNYRYITGAKDGAIILLHDLYQASVSGAIRAMKDMNAGDYEFVTVTELLSRDGTPPKNSVTYYNG